MSKAQQVSATPPAGMRADAILYGGAIVALIAPFFVFETIPLYDLPNHIVRQYLLFAPNIPGADAYYAAHWRLIPNLAMEGWVFVLHKIISIDLAIRTFLALTVAQLVLGTLALHHALFGRCGRLPLAAGLFAYSGPVLLGLVNFCFGLGLALGVAALWLRWRERGFSIGILGLLATLILLTHLFAFFIYAVFVASCWAGVATTRLRAGVPASRVMSATVRALLHLALPAGIYLAAMPHEQFVYVTTGFGWQEKVAAIASLLSYNDPIFDELYLFAIVTAAILLAPRLTIAPQVWWPLASLTVAFLVLPHRLGQATFVDFRLPLCLVLILIGGTAWRNPADPARSRVAALTCALLAVRLAFLYPQWAAWQADYAELRAAFDLLPTGARLLPLESEPGTINLYDHPPLGHVAGFAVLQRGALIPTLFADRGHDLLTYKPNVAALATATPTIRDAENFDYVLLIRRERFNPNLLPPNSEIARGRTFALARSLRSNGFAEK